MQNDAPTGIASTSQNQSVAAFVGADQIAFYHCGFYSTHNTLFDYKGRHYYDNCYIQGSVDFIFGRGRSVFHVIILNSFSFISLYIYSKILAMYLDVRLIKKKKKISFTVKILYLVSNNVHDRTRRDT